MQFIELQLQQNITEPKPSKLDSSMIGQAQMSTCQAREKTKLINVLCILHHKRGDL